MLQVRCPQLHHARLYWSLLLLLLTSGCLRQRAAATVAPALPLTNSLPAAWTPLRDVQAVNIDGDALTEYLLFFTYNNTSTPGPVGAVIYDSQADYTPNLAGDRRDQPSSALIPYALLPSYRPSAGQGFVAEPSQRDAVTFYPINFRSRSATASTTPTADSATTAVAPADALVIRGGNTYLTFVWWQDQADGYGITQLYAAGGFERAPQQAFNWEAWQEAPQPIPEIIAVQPLHDRNLLCRRILHRLVAPNSAELPPAGSPIGALIYQAEDLGLQFCNGAPAAPFYPEGVVLAYLLTGREELRDLAAPNDQTPERFDQLLQRDLLVRVEDLAAYKALAANRTVGDQVRTTTVCAEITVQVPVTTAPAVSRETITATLPLVNGSAPLVERRWLLFTLRHQPPTLNPPTPDQLLIVNVNALAAPPAGVALDCHQQLGG